MTTPDNTLIERVDKIRELIKRGCGLDAFYEEVEAEQTLQEAIDELTRLNRCLSRLGNLSKFNPVPVRKYEPWTAANYMEEIRRRCEYARASRTGGKE